MFKIDVYGPFYKFLAKFTNYLILGVLWILASLPVITIGAANTAMYSTNHKVIQSGNGYMWKTFWAEFRSNFKQATLMWLIMILITVFLAADCYFAYILSGVGGMGILLAVFLVMSAIFLAWSQLWFPYISHIEDPIRVVLKNTLIMCFAHSGQSLLLLILLVICAAILLFLPINPVSIVGVPILYAVFSYKRLFRIFINYWDMDDGHEDILEEDASE